MSAIAAALSSAQDGTPLQLAYRTSKAIGIFNAAPVYTPLGGFSRPEGAMRCCAYSPCGRLFGWASPEGVTVVETASGQIVTVLPLSNVLELGFSPRGTFLITWERPGKDENGDANKNLNVWHAMPHESEADAKVPLGSFVQKSQGGWNLQYTSDEQFCARMVTNEIHLFQSHDLGTVWNKVRVEGVADFALAPGSSHSVAVFIPERKVRRGGDVRNNCVPLLTWHDAALFPRANQPLSRFLRSPKSHRPCPKRRFSRATRCK